MPKIDIDNLSYCYCEKGQITRALLDVSLSIESGEFLCVVGHSGCGKSTLLSLLAGLLKPSCGRILFNSEELPGPDPSRAMVFQNYTLFPWMTVGKNVEFALKHSKNPPAKDAFAAEVKRALGQVNMEASIEKFPFQLSGGMQQRVAIARAIVMRADTMLLDEPFGALDAKNRLELQGLLTSLWESAKPKPNVIFVTHDLDEALLLADRIVFMKPQRIMGVYEVPFERPRNGDELQQTKEYQELRSLLLANFYDSLKSDQL